MTFVENLIKASEGYKKKVADENQLAQDEKDIQELADKEAEIERRIWVDSQIARLKSLTDEHVKPILEDVNTALAGGGGKFSESLKLSEEYEGCSFNVTTITWNVSYKGRQSVDRGYNTETFEEHYSSESLRVLIDDSGGVCVLPGSVKHEVEAVAAQEDDYTVYLHSGRVPNTEREYTSVNVFEEGWRKGIEDQILLAISNNDQYIQFTKSVTEPRERDIWEDLKADSRF